jgi:hypothetical protein
LRWDAGLRGHRVVRNEGCDELRDAGSNTLHRKPHRERQDSAEGCVGDAADIAWDPTALCAPNRLQPEHSHVQRPPSLLSTIRIAVFPSVL